MANIHSEVLTTTDKTDTQQANAPPEPKPSFIKDRTTEQTYCTRTGRGRTIIEDRTTEHYAQKREELCSHLRETDIKRTIQYSIVHARSHARVLSMWFVAFHGNHISKRSMCIPRPYLCNAYSHRHLVRTRFAVLRGYTGTAILVLFCDRSLVRCTQMSKSREVYGIHILVPLPSSLREAVSDVMVGPPACRP